MHKITIIGGGNLGAAIAEGIVQSQMLKPKHIVVTRRNLERINHLKEIGIHITHDNVAAIKEASYIILAVKPYQVASILSEIQPHIDPQRHVLVSVITGVSVQDIQELVGTKMPIFRAMPNTAIAVKESMTCICGTNYTSEQQAFIKDIFDAVGVSIFIEESLMDAATVLGACGTAYAMRYIRANIQGGIEIGFSAETAALIAAQTVKGAASILIEKNTHPEQEIDKVTTPKGCTIAGLNEMEHQGFSSSLIKGIASSYTKIKQDM